MKILFYTNSYDPDPIGIAFYNTEWVEHMATLGHEIEVVTAVPYYPQWKVAPAYRGRWQVEEQRGAARVTRTWVYVPGRQRALGRFLCELSFLLSSLPVLWKARPEVIVAVSPPFGVSVGAAVVSRWRGIPLWLHLQDLQVDAGQAVGFFRSRALVNVLLGLERWILRQARLVTTITEAMRDRVLGKGVSKVGLFPNWTDTGRLQPSSRQTRLRQELGLNGEFVVLYSGNVGIHQGLDQLIDAARRLQDRSDIQFVVAGDGNYREEFAQRLAAERLSNVRLLALQPKERLAELLASADVGLVMETRQMANLSMPSKIWNQMACGRPVIAVTSPETALARVISGSGAGIVLPPDNGDRLAMALLDLRSAPAKIEAMGQAARRLVEAEAAKSKIMERVPGFLRQLLSVKPSLYNEYALKRPLDISLALLGFLVSSPLWVLVPLLIWLEDRGPVFFRQQRTGRFGQPFGALKFRSMRVEELPENDRRQARRGDPRVTRVGHWLRKTAMDEVPQLWNILIGDMSFVGPRALLPSEVEVHAAYRGDVPLSMIEGYEKRVAMRPGLTGIAQVFAARDITRRQKFRYDVIYLRAQCLWLDIVLILRSGWVSATGKWEEIGRRP